MSFLTLSYNNLTLLLLFLSLLSLLLLLLVIITIVTTIIIIILVIMAIYILIIIISIQLFMTNPYRMFRPITRKFLLLHHVAGAEISFF